jgi:hypothetical protein
MVLVTSNQRRSLLQMDFIGDVQPAELQAAWADAVAMLADLPAGFRLLTNFTALDSMHPDCATVIGQVMELCDQKSVGKVVRVIPDPAKDIGLSILTLFHYRHRPIVVTVETVKEAAAQLD